MGTNGTEIAAEPKFEEEIFRVQKMDHSQAPGPLDKTADRKRGGGADPVDSAEDFPLAPLVDKIAYGIAKGMVEAVEELKRHIASETRKVGDTLDRRLDTLQASLQDLSKFVGEQRSTNVSVEDRLQELTVSGAGLRETDARQAAELEALRTETTAFSVSVSERIDVAQNETRTLSQSVSERINGLCKELGVHQEDIAAVTATLCTFSSRVDALLERLDRQGDAVRSMYTAYSQRETELEQLVDGLARLRAYPTPLPTNGL